MVWQMGVTSNGGYMRNIFEALLGCEGDLCEGIGYGLLGVSCLFIMFVSISRII